MEPAKTIIDLCGGAAVVAEMTGRDLSRVHRWTYSRMKGGTDGIIPAAAQRMIMAAARKRGLPLSADHFFATAEDSRGRE